LKREEDKMTNTLIKKIEFDDGGPTFEDMGLDLSDNLVYERREYEDGLVILRDKTGKWEYVDYYRLGTTELLYEMENQLWR
jgi:hypothetical protein